MIIGTVHLEKGRGELALRAKKIPGSQVMEGATSLSSHKK